MAQSRLWKATLLANNSRYFPQMVQAASWHLNKEYTNHMLRKVASTIAIVDALNIPDGGDVRGRRPVGEDVRRNPQRAGGHPDRHGRDELHTACSRLKRTSRLIM